jgi:UDP-GlcNAc:undecaprenyl-phosphate GlcNAc-1-phosphate transferase
VETPLTAPLLALAALGSAALCFALTPFVRRLAVALGVLDQPDPRKVHTGAVPRWGGVAVGVAAALAVTAALAASPTLRDVLFTGSGAWRWAAIAAGSLVILVTGMIDDARGLPAQLKLGLEILAAALVVAAAPYPHAVALGPATAPHGLGVLGAIFAILWIVTLTNAVNMTDVVDGVAGGLGAIAALALGVVAIALGRVVASVVLLALGGALLGFLPHNFRRHRIFLGDSGSLVVGFLLGAASLVGLTRDGVWYILPAVLALGLPLAECGITVLRRTARAMTIERHESPRERFVMNQGPPRLFTPDARHIPHRLLGLGLSTPAALAVLYGSAVVLGALAFVSVRWPWIGLWGGIVAAAILAYSATRWWYEELRFLDRGALLPLFMNQFVHHRMTHAVWDAGVATLAFLVAATLVPGAAAGMPDLWLRTGLVVGAMVAGLWLARIYRGSYLHAGLAEAIRATRAVIVGLILAMVAWWIVVGGHWRVAGWLLFGYLTLTGVVGARLVFRLLEYVHQRAAQGQRRVVIFGAGRAGRQALATMLANPILGFLPLGFVDDDERLHGAELHGYPVHEASDGLVELFQRLGVTDLVLSAPGAAPERRSTIAEQCRRGGVRLLTYQVQWDAAEDWAAPAEPLAASGEPA